MLESSPHLQRPRLRRRHVVLALAALAALGAGAYGVHQWRYWDRHVSTDDAFVEAHVSPVSARIRGNVVKILVRDNEEVTGGAARVAPVSARIRGNGVKILVRDNEEVTAGAALVRLDTRDFEVKVDQTRAALTSAESRLQVARARVPLAA